MTGWISKFFTCVLISSGALAACQPAAVAEDPSIRAVLHKTFDKPGVELVLDPIAVSGDHSVVDWTQGAMGGRALLRRVNGAWTIVLCAGDQIRSAEVLVTAGVPAGDAGAIARQLADGEARTSPERLKLMSTFAGIVRMDGDASSH